MASRASADAAVAAGLRGDVDRALDPSVLDGNVWAHRTPPLRALGFDFEIRTTSGEVGRYLEDLLRAFRVGGGSGHVYSFLDRPRRPQSRYELYRDREHISTTPTASTALGHLLWDVNRSVVEHTPDLLLFHASAVERGGRAVMFPAPMGSGKTTLAAGLVMRGLRYVTDETVAIDPATLCIRPYPKPLGIDPGSKDVLPGLRPDVEPSLQPFLEDGWYVAPDAIRDGAVAPPCVPTFVITPRYERGARSELVEMHRSEALITLAENSFNVPAFGARRSMEILAGVVRQSRCYRLTVGDLAQACSLVLELLDTTGGS